MRYSTELVTVYGQGRVVSVYVCVCVCSSVHIVMAEDLVVHAGRDGGLKTMEVQGILKLRISDPDYGFIKVQVSVVD